VLLEMRAQQNELVRIEEAAEVGVGKRPRMRGIARAFKAVEVERGERIGRRDLVVDKNPPAGRSHARKLRDRTLRARDVMQGPARTREVEGPRLERQGRHVALDKGHVFRCALARTLQQLGDDVNADHVAHQRREGERERSGARPGIEGVLLAAWLDERANLLTYQLDLPLGMLGDERRGCAEARTNLFGVRSRLRHRSPSCARGADRSRPRRRARS
jgi:hypothetical protein